MRFIPGYAGNADPDITPDRRHAVYPRLRGERNPEFQPMHCIGGLSPATRGTLLNTYRTG